MNLIFDSHAHYDDEAFDADREELLASLVSKGVGNVVDISAALPDLPKILELTKQYDFIYGAAGVHPSDTGDLTESNFSEIEEALKDPKMVAVGEIGLDYHYEDTDKPVQKKWFAAQIALARREDYPIVIHSRDAAKDTLDIVMAEHARDVGGVVHCFSYEKEMARSYLDLGFYIGIGGVLTFKNSRTLKSVARDIPLDSTLLSYVVDVLSEIRGIDREELIGKTAENAARMYRINL